MLILKCNKQILSSVENEAKHLGGCTIKCTKHIHNRYIKIHDISKEEVTKRIAILEKSLNLA